MSYTVERIESMKKWTLKIEKYFSLSLNRKAWKQNQITKEFVFDRQWLNSQLYLIDDQEWKNEQQQQQQTKKRKLYIRLFIWFSSLIFMAIKF